MKTSHVKRYIMSAILLASMGACAVGPKADIDIENSCPWTMTLSLRVGLKDYGPWVLVPGKHQTFQFKAYKEGPYIVTLTRPDESVQTVEIGFVRESLRYHDHLTIESSKLTLVSAVDTGNDVSALESTFEKRLKWPVERESKK